MSRSRRYFHHQQLSSPGTFGDRNPVVAEHDFTRRAFAVGIGERLRPDIPTTGSPLRWCFPATVAGCSKGIGSVWRYTPNVARGCA